MNYSIIKNDNSWIEGEAILQLENTSKLEGMIQVVGLPDLHPGKGFPIGIAALSSIIHPYLIGSDIGCGMSLSVLDKKKHQIKIDKTMKKLQQLESLLSEEDRLEFASKNNIQNEDAYSLGTVGFGNHFCELQFIEEVFSEEIANKYLFEKNQLTLLTHTGSRGLGESILRWYLDKYSHTPIKNDLVANEYISKHNYALNWAKVNREIISNNALELIGCNGQTILDIPHNFVEKQVNNYLHRKGATCSSEQELVVIPGSRGSYSYLVQPKLNIVALNSLAHGAGRKWKRGDCKGKLSSKFTTQELKKTKMGSFVICEDKDLLYEEAPEAYKNIEEIITVLLENNLITLVAKLHPIVTYKKF